MHLGWGTPRGPYLDDGGAGAVSFPWIDSFSHSGQGVGSDACPPLTNSFTLLNLGTYARSMKTQFVVWLGFIVLGLGYMTYISFSGR
jgi:hypothetical protein